MLYKGVSSHKQGFCCSEDAVSSRPSSTSGSPSGPTSGSYSLSDTYSLTISGPWEERCNIDAPFQTPLSEPHAANATLKQGFVCDICKLSIRIFGYLGSNL